MADIKFESEDVIAFIEYYGALEILLVMLIGMVVVMIIFAVINSPKIFRFVEERRKLRVSNLNEALQNENVQGLTKEFMQEEVETEYFKIVTGVWVGKNLREAMIELYKKGGRELGFHNYIRALPHLFYEDSRLIVRISIIDYLGYIYNQLFGWIMFAVSLLILFLCLILLFITGFKMPIEQVFMLFVLGGISLIIAGFMLFSSLPVLSAKRVEKQLEKSS